MLLLSVYPRLEIISFSYMSKFQLDSGKAYLNFAFEYNTSHRAGFDTRSFLLWRLRGEGDRTCALLDKVDHRATRCNVN